MQAEQHAVKLTVCLKMRMVNVNVNVQQQIHVKCLWKQRAETQRNIEYFKYEQLTLKDKPT